MEGFRTTMKDVPQYIDWNSFNIENINGSTVIIYAHDLEKDVQKDIEKANILKSMPNLTTLTICSTDFNVGIYMSELLKDVPVAKGFDLIDDFKTKDRSDVIPTRLAKGTRISSIPNSYIQWGAKNKMLKYGFHYIDGVPISLRDSADMPRYYPSEDALAEIDKVISGFSKIPDLTLIDKVVLVSNYLQRHVQFVSGKISEAVDGKYKCEDYSYEKYGGIDTVDNVLFDRIGKCNCISRTMMLMLNNPKMNVNCRIASTFDHSFCTIYDDESGELYCVDPTWCISRNPNRFAETLKASKFCDEYLMIGKDKLATMSHHDNKNVLQQEFAENSIDRNLIQQSVEKLKGYGIEFEYPEEIPLKSEKIGTEPDDNNNIVEL